MLTEQPPSSAGKGWSAKYDVAWQRAELIRFPDPDRIDGRCIVIYDDICTTGLQLEMLARRLTSEGAASVRAVVLARAPYRG